MAGTSVSASPQGSIRSWFATYVELLDWRCVSSRKRAYLGEK
jgi:hypothetical protein